MPYGPHLWDDACKHGGPKKGICGVDEVSFSIMKMRQALRKRIRSFYDDLQRTVQACTVQYNWRKGTLKLAFTKCNMLFCHCGKVDWQLLKA